MTTNEFFLQTKKISYRDVDVEEIYLSNKELEKVPDFSKYSNLKRLYLNSNKFFHLSSGFKLNYSLTELYLQNNKLVDINGYLEHLTCMKILLLHGNQLTSLTDVIYELRHMMNLKVLNLMNNPLAQEYNYRDYVIYNVKSLELFDRRAVQKAEREKVFKKYEIDRQIIKDTIAFGRRLGDDDGSSTAATKQQTRLPNSAENNQVERHEGPRGVQDDLILAGVKHDELTEEDKYESADDIITRKNMTLNQKYADAIEARAKTRSNMQFKVFDWLEVLESRERKCNGGKTEKETGNNVIIYAAKLK